ncbi:MAG: hypothetical protein ABSD63_07700 [Candidatus Korobacteraceae bacterium]|jgi:hypothetical protein
MKTQVVHSSPTTLGPFLKLILTLTLQGEAETAQKLQNSAGGAPDLSATATGEQQRVVGRARYVLTRAFLTLLLGAQSRGTSHHAGSLTDRDWRQGSTAPRGAVLAARYVSR